MEIEIEDAAQQLQRLLLAVRAGNVGLWDWDIRTNKVRFSPEWKHQLGYEDHEISDDFGEWQSRVHPDDVGQILKLTQAFLEKPRPGYKAEFRIRHKDGSYRWVLGQAALDFDDEGKPAHMLGSQVDITDQKHAERIERAHHLVLETTLDGFILYDTSGYVLEVNQSYVRMTGYARDELIGMHISELSLISSTPEAVKTRIESIIEQGGHSEFETKHRHRNGHQVLFRVSNRYLSEANCIYSFLHDITEQRKAEESLLRSERNYREVIEQAGDAITIADHHGKRYLDVNQAACNLFGYSREEFLELGLRDFFDPDDLEGTSIRLEEMWAGKVIKSERRLRRKDGSFVAVEMNAKMLSDGRLLSIKRDITERIEAARILKSREERFQALFDRASEGISIVSAGGKLIAANESYARMHGYTPQEILTKNLRDLDITGGISMIPERMRRILSGESLVFEVDNYHKDGHTFPMEVSASLINIDGVDLIQSFSRDITERKRAEAELRIASVAFEIQESLMITDARGVILRVNQAFIENTGYTAEEIVGQTPRILKSGHHDTDFYRAMWGAISQTGTWQGEIWDRRKNGEIYPKWLTISTVKGNDGVITHYVGSHIDITARKQQENQISENEHRLAEILNVSPIAVRIATRQGRKVVYHNRSYADLIKNVDALGDDPQKYYARVEDYEEVLLELAQGKSIINRQIEFHIPCNSSTAWVLASYMPMQYKGEDAVLGWFYDITERKSAEEKIRQLAFHDSLTRLPNRQLLLDRLQHALASSARNERKGAVLFIDLDNFKTLNDSLGHVLGDLLLQQVAERLVSCVREGDTVARLGGDEFVVMLEDLSEETIEAAEQAEGVGEKILAALSRPYQLNKPTFRGSGSIGATVFGRENQDTEELLKQADIAMYQAKKEGRNILRFFDHKMQEAINTRVALEEELHKALANRQFQLHYQIQVGRSRCIIGAEALIRWEHPEHGLVAPAKFIPLAEETGLILPIGHWLLETACAQLKAWQKDDVTQHLTLAVNVSAKQFRQADFVSQVESSVQRHGITPGRLKLELTESLLLDNVEETIAIMNALRAIGVQLSLDDFGTGYSSLQYLKKLPLNQIKIDQSFVRDITTDPSDAAIVQTIIAMAETLNLEVIAEGVETEAQRAFLDLRGCRAYQGYLFGRPTTIEQFEVILRQS
jgi:diguanylate cyclase (GGDEF)-like protein/PAS domain S-box-containing protein